MAHPYNESNAALVKAALRCPVAAPIKKAVNSLNASNAFACIRQPSRQALSTHLEPMHLHLSDQETAALTKELHEIVENDRYPFSLSRSHLRCSPSIRTLRGILAKPRPEPVREPLPPPKVYAPLALTAKTMPLDQRADECRGHKGPA